MNAMNEVTITTYNAVLRFQAQPGCVKSDGAAIAELIVKAIAALDGGRPTLHVGRHLQRLLHEQNQ